MRAYFSNYKIKILNEFFCLDVADYIVSFVEDKTAVMYKNVMRELVAVTQEDLSSTFELISELKDVIRKTREVVEDFDATYSFSGSEEEKTNILDYLFNEYVCGTFQVEDIYTYVMDPFFLEEDLEFAERQKNFISFHAL
jgi:hypothetical protein